MSALAFRAARCACPARAQSSRATRSRLVVVYAEPKFTLENSTQAAEGFVEKDTAGQTNMFPTMMKPYEAGSSSDTVNQDTFNNGLAVGTSAVALLAIGAGLTALVGSGSPEAADLEDYSQYKSLSVYSAKFSSELAPVRAAPVVVAAPEPVAVAEEAAPAVAAEVAAE